jgi:hypothetical protein
MANEFSTLNKIISPATSCSRKTSANRIALDWHVKLSNFRYVWATVLITLLAPGEEWKETPSVSPTSTPVVNPALAPPAQNLVAVMLIMQLCGIGVTPSAAKRSKVAVAANASRPCSSIWLVTTSVAVRAPVELKMKNL